MKSNFISFYVYFLRQAGIKIVGVMTMGVVSGVSSAALMAQISAKIRDQSLMENSKGLWLFLGYSAIFLGATALSGHISNSLAQGISFTMRMDLCQRILSSPLRYIEKASPHRVIATLTQDISTMTNAFVRVPQLIINIAIVAACLSYLGFVSAQMLLGLAAFILLSIISYLLPQWKADNYYRMAREEWDNLVKQFRAIAEGTKELKLNREKRQAFWRESLAPAGTKYSKLSFIGADIYTLINSWSQTLYFIAIAVILFTLPSLISGIDSGVLTTYALTALYMSGPIANIIGVMPILNNARISAQKIEKLVGLLKPETAAGKEAGEGGGFNQPWESLELCGVVHSYSREDLDGDFILGPINLTFKPGEITFLIGGNGSGKTTFGKILCGLYVPEKGEIRLNDKLVTDHNREDYCQYFSVIFSDFYLFERLLGCKEDTAANKYQECLVKLRLDQKVKIEGNKLSTINLSHGQRKRLALLDAYLEDRPIYIFDEWASDQDPMFREIFYLEILPELKAKGKAAIVISHDDRYYGAADRIIKLDSGEITYNGPPENHLTFEGYRSTLKQSVLMGL